MPCCEQAKWKREEIADHKFDFIDVDEFVENAWTRKLKYSFVFILTLKSFISYLADIILVSVLFATNSFSSTRNCSPNSTYTGILSCVPSTQTEFILPTVARPWVILATIIISFILLIIDWKKSQAIIRSKDISYAFTSPITYRYYALRSYAHYCFFCQIQNSRKTKDVLAFYVFFQFKGWKRLLLAEFPRQLIIALSLYDVINVRTKKAEKNILLRYFGAVEAIVTTSTSKAELIAYSLSTLTMAIWIVSFIGLVAAFFIYIPLVCNIRGNLKEYCCHKIDKRIGELLKKKSRKRTEEARIAELAELERNNVQRRRHDRFGAASVAGSSSSVAGDVSDTASIASEQTLKTAPPLGMTQRPTLPEIDVDLDAPVMRVTPPPSLPGSGHGTLSIPRHGNNYSPPSTLSFERSRFSPRHQPQQQRFIYNHQAPPHHQHYHQQLHHPNPQQLQQYPPLQHPQNLPYHQQSLQLQQQQHQQQLQHQQQVNHHHQHHHHHQYRPQQSPNMHPHQLHQIQPMQIRIDPEQLHHVPWDMRSGGGRLSPALGPVVYHRASPPPSDSGSSEGSGKALLG